MKRVIFNQKGGVGKTSITCNLAAAFAKLGRKVLVVDLDSQCNASQYLLGERFNGLESTVGDFFESLLSFKLFSDPLKEAVIKTNFENLSLIPGDRALAELQPKLEARYKIFKLRDGINELSKELGFDDVFFDTPPALNFYSMSALMAADRVLIPFDCDAFSHDALKQVMFAIEEVTSDHHPDLLCEGIIVNHYQQQAKLPGEAIQKLESNGFKVLKPYLTTSIVMRESHAAHIPVVNFQPKHKLATEFMDLAHGLNLNFCSKVD